MTKQQETDKQAALERLRKALKPGDKVYVTVLHVSRSGMLRSIKATIIQDGRPWDISYLVAHIFGESLHKTGGVKMGGCGMDMGFALVYNLSSALFPDGFDCIGDRCPASDHCNGDRDYSPGHRHARCGGYALRKEWL